MSDKPSTDRAPDAQASEAEQEIDGLDPLIAPIVALLRAHRVETFESCQSGPGHSFLEPTVRFHGQSMEGYRAVAVALEHGLTVGALRRVWDIIDGELVGPQWEMTFWLKGQGKDARNFLEGLNEDFRRLREDPRAWADEQRERVATGAAPQPAAPDDAQTLAVIVGSVADAMEDAGAALNVAESRARHVEKRLMESRVPAQPAPVAHGELSEIARIIARYHEGAGTEPSDEDRAAAREIHAEYERRAAQSESVRELREAWLDWLAFRGRFATGHDVISCICVKCETLRAAIFQTVDNALAKHEAAHE